jgi:3-hydroxymyristoyl/3-hydroxydecanoyl-(acyl carrier protein) dehydratase
VRGRYWIPGGIGAFPQSLAAEAVGQLAAWAAMAQFGFTLRPVAGLAQEIVFYRRCIPGESLELDVALESCTEEAISYSGTARSGGDTVLALNHSVGPMLPMADFDDPAAVAADFALLAGSGRAPGACAGIDAPLGELVRCEPEQSLEARLVVPEGAAFFADHFPLRPVFPATLLMHALGHWAVEFQGGADACRLAAVANVKMRSWILSGQQVDLRIERVGGDQATTAVKLSARVGDRGVAAARATLAAKAVA